MNFGMQANTPNFKTHIPYANVLTCEHYISKSLLVKPYSENFFLFQLTVEAEHKVHKARKLLEDIVDSNKGNCGISFF